MASPRLAWLGGLLAGLAATGFVLVARLANGFVLPQGVSATAVPVSELAFLATYFVLGGACWAGLSLVLARQPKLGATALRLLDRPERVAAGCALFVFVASVAMRTLWLRGEVLADDEHTYRFVAATLLEGRLSNPPPFAAEFLRNQFVHADAAHWHAKYPIGHGLVLALGRALGVEGLVVPALGAATVWLTFAVGRRLLGARAAAAACVLLALSPQFVWTHATLLSQPSSALCLGLALFALLRALEAPALRWAVLCGGALGFGVLVRPLPTLLFAPVMLWAYVTMQPDGAWQGDARMRRGLELLCAGLALSVGVLALGWVNTAHWGGPLRTGAELLHKRGTGAFLSDEMRLGWSLFGNLLRENFWLHGWPLSFVLLPFARMARGGALLWALVFAALGYRLLVPKTVFATTGPIYFLEVVPLLCLLSVAGARELVQRARTRGTDLVHATARVVGLAVAGTLVAALMFVPAQLGTLHTAVEARLDVREALRRAGLSRALVFATPLVHPGSGKSWAYFAPNPSPRLDDAQVFLRYLYDQDGYARMHALWRSRFADRRAALWLLTADGHVVIVELPVDPDARPTLPPEILFALPS